MKKCLLVVLAVSFWFLAAPTGVFAQTATLSLNPSTGTFGQGCNFSVKIDLDTGGAQTDGTDAILFYDSSRLTATSITNGTIYPDYPGNNVDAAGGKITISGLASVSTPFSGTGTLATVNFTVLSNAATGATQVTFDFDPNNKAKTIDSNVVQRGTVVDLLNSVVSGNYTIGTGSCDQASVTPTSAPVTRGAVTRGGGTGSPEIVTIATPEAQKTQYKVLPPAGSEKITYAVAIIGLSITVLGILGLALL